MTASKQNAPDVYADAILSINGEIKDSVSLDGRSFYFKVPRFLNITAGNSGDQLSTLVFQVPVGSPTGNDADSIVPSGFVTCTYKGIGMNSPFYPEEIAAANAYEFQRCNDVLPGGQTTTGLQPIRPGNVVPVLKFFSCLFLIFNSLD